jgi:Domain of unknown function (DUF4331)
MLRSVIARPVGEKRAVIAGVAAVLALGLAAGALAPLRGGASSHREAPLISADPQADTTDVYAFRSPDAPNKVTLIASWIPFEEPAGGPNFYPFAKKTRYDINVDNDGDARPDLTYRWKFRDHYRSKNTFLYATGPVTSLVDENLNFFQTYDLFKRTEAGPWRRLVDDKIVVPSNVGKGSMPNYRRLFEQGTTRFGNGGKSWAGQSDDAFFLDLRIFDLLYGGDLSETGDDTLAGFNVNTVALQEPMSKLAAGGKPGRHPIIGVYSTTARKRIRVLRRDGGQIQRNPFVQVSRLGSPLVNEVVIPLKDKNAFNASSPKEDAQFLNYVNKPEVPALIEALYGIPQPDSDENQPGIQRDDLIAVFLTGVDGLNQPRNVRPSEMLRLNMSIPPCRPGQAGCDYSRLGVIGGDVAGYPNGRRLADDVVDITLQVAEGELLDNPNDLGDGVDRNDKPFLSRFPYVAVPHSGSDPDPHDN